MVKNIPTGKETGTRNNNIGSVNINVVAKTNCSSQEIANTVAVMWNNYLKTGTMGYGYINKQGLNA
jgi:hypothetical protein